MKLSKGIIAVICLLFINSIASVASVYLGITNESAVYDIVTYYKLAISGLVAIFGCYLIFLLFSQQSKGIEWCFVFCLLQLLTIESKTLAIGLNFGTKVGLALDVGNSIVSINFIALLTLLIVYRLRGRQNG